MPAATNASPVTTTQKSAPGGIHFGTIKAVLAMPVKWASPKKICRDSEDPSRDLQHGRRPRRAGRRRRQRVDDRRSGNEDRLLTNASNGPNRTGPSDDRARPIDPRSPKDRKDEVPDRHEQRTYRTPRRVMHCDSAHNEHDANRIGEASASGQFVAVRLNRLMRGARRRPRSNR